MTKGYDPFDPTWCQGSHTHKTVPISARRSARSHGGTPSYNGVADCNHCGRTFRCIIKNSIAHIPAHKTKA